MNFLAPIGRFFLEFLSAVGRVALFVWASMSGLLRPPFYTKMLLKQLVELGYPGHTLRQRNTSPPESVLHFLDELGFWGYWNLLRYEPNPELRGLYRRSLERTYEVVRVEQHPWLNLVARRYGATYENKAGQVRNRC